MANQKAKPYEVGRGKPPLHTRFQKGVCPNPAGRPKGARNLKTEFLEELGEEIPVTEGGKQRKYSKQRLAVKALVAKAVKGDVRAITKIIELWMKMGGLAETPPAEANVQDGDREILAAFLERYSARP